MNALVLSEAEVMTSELEQLRAKHKDLSSKLQALKKEYEEVARFLQSRFPNRFGEDDTTDSEQLNPNIEGRKKFSETEIKVGEKEEKKATEYWRELATTCHPDKTDDKVKHDFFLQAKQYRDSGDTEGFMMIYLELQEYKKTNSLLYRMLYRSKLISGIENARNNLHRLQTLPFYTLVQVYRQSPEAAVILFEQSAGA